MALYDRGALGPNDSISSPAYKRAALLHYRADLDPARVQAINELGQEYSGRGLSGGGQNLGATLANRNSYIQQLSQQNQNLGLEQAGANEIARQRVEGRGWQTADMAKQQQLEDTLQGWNQEDYDAYRRALPMKKLFGGIGKLGGAAVSQGFTPSSTKTTR
jgi:hypothetical protein